MTSDPNMEAGWHRVSPGNDFIPHGPVRGIGKGAFDSHICFASGRHRHPSFHATVMSTFSLVFSLLVSVCASLTLVFSYPLRALPCTMRQAGVPLRLEDEIRIFYMGGDGPHYSPSYPSPLHRNSSFGLATLRQDGFVALRAVGGKGLFVFRVSHCSINMERGARTVTGMAKVKDRGVGGEKEM